MGAGRAEGVCHVHLEPRHLDSIISRSRISARAFVINLDEQHERWTDFSKYWLGDDDRQQPGVWPGMASCLYRVSAVRDDEIRGRGVQASFVKALRDYLELSQEEDKDENGRSSDQVAIILEDDALTWPTDVKWPSVLGQVFSQFSCSNSTVLLLGGHDFRLVQEHELERDREEASDESRYRMRPVKQSFGAYGWAICRSQVPRLIAWWEQLLYLNLPEYDPDVSWGFAFGKPLLAVRPLIIDHPVVQYSSTWKREENRSRFAGQRFW